MKLGLNRGFHGVVSRVQDDENLESSSCGLTTRVIPTPSSTCLSFNPATPSWAALRRPVKGFWALILSLLDEAVVSYLGAFGGARAEATSPTWRRWRSGSAERKAAHRGREGWRLRRRSARSICRLSPAPQEALSFSDGSSCSLCRSRRSFRARGSSHPVPEDVHGREPTAPSWTLVPSEPSGLADLLEGGRHRDGQEERLAWGEDPASDRPDVGAPTLALSVILLPSYSTGARWYAWR